MYVFVCTTTELVVAYIRMYSFTFKGCVQYMRDTMIEGSIRAKVIQSTKFKALIRERCV